MKIKFLLLFITAGGFSLFFVQAKPLNNATNSEESIFKHPYFKLEGNVSQSCRESLVNSFAELPEGIQYYLLEEINRRGEKYIFKRISFEEAKNTLYRGTVHGVPVFSPFPHTILHTSNVCHGRIDRTIVHEIGHLVYASIQINRPLLAQKWSKLWQSIFKRNGSPQDPLSIQCTYNDCPFIGWKDADNESEGFAQLITVSIPQAEEQKNSNKNPDYLKKMEFLDELINLGTSLYNVLSPKTL